MFVFGHTGFGSLLTRPWRERLSFRWTLLGTLLPDIIDKSLYYGLSFSSGKRGAELGLISGTRTFGHTMIFLAILTTIAFWRRSKALASICAGILTHFVLDVVPDIPKHSLKDFDGRPFFWPLGGWDFPIYPFADLQDQVSRVFESYFFITEMTGFVLILWALSSIRRLRNKISPDRIRGR